MPGRLEAGRTSSGKSTAEKPLESALECERLLAFLPQTPPARLLWTLCWEQGYKGGGCGPHLSKFLHLVRLASRPVQSNREKLVRLV